MLKYLFFISILFVSCSRKKYDTFYIEPDHGAYTLASEYSEWIILDRVSEQECVEIAESLSRVNIQGYDSKEVWGIYANLIEGNKLFINKKIIQL